MKRVISSYICAMSMNRSDALTKIASYSAPVCDHAVKLALYDDSLQCKDHWIKELAVLISTVNDITIKPARKKLSRSQYDSTIFGGVGDTLADAKLNLYSWVLENRKTKEYPQIQLPLENEEELICKVFEVSEIIRSYGLQLLVTHNSETVTSIFNSLKELL